MNLRQFSILSKLFDKRLKADNLIVWIVVAFVMVQRLVLDLLGAGEVMMVMLHMNAVRPAPYTPSTPRRGALSSVYLSANNRNGLLIDRSRIPCPVGPTSANLRHIRAAGPQVERCGPPLERSLTSPKWIVV